MTERATNETQRNQMKRNKIGEKTQSFEMSELEERFIAFQCGATQTKQSNKHKRN